MSTVTLRDRILGAMVGKLYGDAKGAPVEWFTPDGVAEYFRKNGQAFRDYLDPWALRRGEIAGVIKAGQPTDDSELAATLATSLIAKQGVCSEDIFASLRRFIIDRKSILTNKAFGSGGTLRAALTPATYQESVAKFEAGEIPTPPSNGSLMRCAPIPLMYAGSTEKTLMSRAIKQSMVTHRNEECLAACAAYSLFMQQVLKGYPVGEAWLKAVAIFNRYPSLEAFAKLPITKPDYESEMVGKEGYVVLSLRVAVWASATAFNFEDGINKAIEVGGDTDTYAAIAGGILGARFGYQGIPVEGKVALQGREVMEKLGAELYELAQTKTLQEAV